MRHREIMETKSKCKRRRVARILLVLAAFLPAAWAGEAAMAGPWSQTVKLLPGAVDAGDEFGYDVSVSGYTAIAGAWRDNPHGDSSGTVYIFQDSGSAWTQVTDIAPADGSSSDYFGSTVCISGDIAIVGACGDDDNSESSSGSAYIFYRDQGGADNWGQVAKLHASDPDGGDQFGICVALSGDTAVVGALYDDDHGTNSGSAYVFQKDQGGADSWGFVRKLTASDADASDYFGREVAISGDHVIVGARGNDDGANHAGSAYVFDRDKDGADQWGEVKKLVASDPGEDDWFGHSVAISGDTAVVGAYEDDEGAHTDCGSAYVFQKNQGGAGNWGEVTRLLASDYQMNDEFGTSVAISNDLIVAGAPNDGYPGATHGGSAYVFRYDGSTWNQEDKVTPSDIVGGDYDRFADAVSVCGNQVVIGRPSDDVNGDKAGAVYVFGGPVTAVAEPGSFALVLLGLGGIIGLKRRK